MFGESLLNTTGRLVGAGILVGAGGLALNNGQAIYDGVRTTYENVQEDLSVGEHSGQIYDQVRGEGLDLVARGVGEALLLSELTIIVGDRRKMEANRQALGGKVVSGAPPIPDRRLDPLTRTLTVGVGLKSRIREMMGSIQPPEPPRKRFDDRRRPQDRHVSGPQQKRPGTGSQGRR